MASIFLDALQQCLLFLPLCLSMYLTYRLAQLVDLTVEGSYVLGAGVYAKVLTLGSSLFLGVVLALVSGMLAGLLSFALQRFAKLNSLIASVLALFMLSSVELIVMGTPNISLLDHENILNQLQISQPLFFTLVLCGLILFFVILFYLFCVSRTGLLLRALGDNPNLLQRLNGNAYFYLGLSLLLSNALAAAAGLLNGVIGGYADIHMGEGLALTAIGVVVIGVQLAAVFHVNGKLLLALELLGCLIGAFIYFFLVHLFLLINYPPVYLKLFLGLVLSVFLSLAFYVKKNAGENGVIQ